MADISFCLFIDRDGIEVHKQAKKERSQYPGLFDRTSSVNKGWIYYMEKT